MMDTPSVFSGLSGITLMQQLNMMQQQASSLGSSFQANSPQSSHNLSSTKSEPEEKMDSESEQIEEIQPEQPMEIKNDESIEVQVQ